MKNKKTGSIDWDMMDYLILALICAAVIGGIILIVTYSTSDASQTIRNIFGA